MTWTQPAHRETGFARATSTVSTRRVTTGRPGAATTCSRSAARVSPVEVESILVAHPAVLECAVVGQEDADGLVKPHAFVALRPEVRAEGLEEALQALAREKLEPYKCPRWITFVPELPKPATGKIQRYLLRQKQLKSKSRRAERAAARPPSPSGRGSG